MKIDVSTGEVVDKVTILEIKLNKIKDETKLKNVKKEFQLLTQRLKNEGVDTNIPEYQKLKQVNLNLWEIEDKIRIKESKKEFDDEFIQLARSVYFENDERAALKKAINIKFASDLVEEKEYVDYKSEKSE